MTARFSDAQNAARAFFASRHEEMIVAEAVIEMNRGNGKKPKPRVLALCQASAGTFVRRTVYILNEADTGSDARRGSAAQGRFRIKDQQQLSRISQVKAEGTTVLMMQFSGAGSATVSFESGIQRDLFLAALKRGLRSGEREAQSSTSALDDLDDGGNVWGARSPTLGRRGAGGENEEGEDDEDIVVSSSVATLQANIRVKRQKEKRLEQHAAWTPTEERTVLEEMRHLGVPAGELMTFADKVDERIGKINGTLSHMMIELDRQWREAASATQALLDDVADAEEMIENLAGHLMSRRRTIEEIEHACTTMQRKKENLEKLSQRLAELRQQIDLSEGAEAILMQLQRSENVMEFFSDHTKAQTAVATIKHINSVLERGRQLRRKFPIDATMDRLQQFAAFSRLIAIRARDFVYGVISHCADAYYADRTRISSKNALRLIPHEEVMESIMSIAPMLETLGRVDRQGYDGAIRFYCTRMQRVYQREIRPFFVELRRHFRQVGWIGEPLLGNEALHAAQLGQYVAAGEIGDSPMRGSAAGSLTPHRSHHESSRSGGGGDAGHFAFPTGVPIGRVRSATSGSCVGAKTDELELSLPNLGNKVLRGTSKIDLALSNKRSAAAASVASAFASRITGESGGGSIRPDIVFAIALEAVADVAVAEERVLEEGFAMKLLLTVSTEPPGGDGGIALALKELFAADAMLSITATAGRSAAALGEDADHDDTVESGTARRRGASAKSILKRSITDVTVKEADILTAELLSFLDHLLARSDRVYVISMLTMVNLLLNRLESREGRSPFATAILRRVRRVLTASLHSYVATHIQTIRDSASKFVSGKTALLNCFTNLPIFLTRMLHLHSIVQFEEGDRVEDLACHAVETLSQLLDYSFEALEQTSAAVATAATSSVAATTGTALGVSLPFGMSQADVDAKNMTHNYFLLYRHYSYFCVVVATTLPSGSAAGTVDHGSRPPLAQPARAANLASSPDPWAPVFESITRENPMMRVVTQLLRSREEMCRAKRERYAELYLTKRIFVVYFGEFAAFALRAEDLLRTYDASELVHQRSISKDVVMKLLSALPKNFFSACCQSAAKIHTHCTRDLRARSADEGFHRSLLRTTWARFRQLVVDKLGVVDRLLELPTLNDLRNPVTLSKAEQWLDEAAARGGGDG